VLAAVGLAPRLHHCEPIDGGPLMVVMDAVHGGSAATLKGPLPTPVMKNVREAIDCLHTAGLVFGDLRRPNIMLLNGADAWSRSDGEQGVAGQGTLYASSQPGGLARTRHAMLIDFDWAGEEGLGTYPLDMNTKDISWADGVGPGAPLMKEHDDVMFNSL
jgi:hypothetical protein